MPPSSRDRWELFGRFFMCLWVLFALPSEVQLVRAADPGAYAGAFAFFAWAVIWVWFWARTVGRDHRGEVIALAGTTVILALAAIAAPSPVGAGGILVFAFIMAGACFEWRTALWIIAGLSM